MTPAETLALAAQHLREGQSLEARPTADSLAAALRCYEQALTLLRTLPLAQPEVRHHLAITSMNRGNALQRLNSPTALANSVQAYDEAIAFFRTLPLDQHPELRNSLGAAWMNRGHALYLQADPARVAEAVRSQAEAVTTLRTLPLDSDRSFRLNLAAAWMNQANALLALDDDQPAADAAREALIIAAPGESQDPLLADIALKARRARCEAIGRLLFRAARRGESTDSLADEASDLVDEGLALARRWEARGETRFRPISTRLFRFGAQLYRMHLPDFLAEFLLEHIDPDRSAGAMSNTSEFYEMAAEALTIARQDLENRRTVFLDTPETMQLLERLRDLRAAQARLTELRSRHCSTASS